jgi:hypothetical protein
MNLLLTPLYFLISTLAGLLFVMEFIKKEIYLRVRKNEGWMDTDRALIVLSVTCTSLYFIWSIGGMAFSYFGGFYLFSDSMSKTQFDFVLIDIIIESLQRTIAVLALCLTNFQIGLLSREKSPPRIWKKLLCLYGTVRFFVPLALFVFTKGKSQSSHLITYIYSVAEGVFVIALILASYVHAVFAMRGSENIEEFLATKAYMWNLSILRGLFFAVATDCLSRAILTAVILLNVRIFMNSPLVMDLACILRSTSTILTLHIACSTRIPRNKPFNIDAVVG